MLLVDCDEMAVVAQSHPERFVKVIGAGAPPAMVDIGGWLLALPSWGEALAPGVAQEECLASGAVFLSGSASLSGNGINTFFWLWFFDDEPAIAFGAAISSA